MLIPEELNMLSDEELDRMLDHLESNQIKIRLEKQRRTENRTKELREAATQEWKDFNRQCVYLTAVITFMVTFMFMVLLAYLTRVPR